MAENLPTRASRSGLQWFVDFLIEKWPLILGGVGGTRMGFLARATDWMKTYGPVAWGAVGVGSFLLLVGAIWVVAIAQRIRAQTLFARRREETAQINPLEDHFVKRRIKLFDFFHPFYHP